MKLRDNQTFLSLYYQPHTAEVATGGGGFVCFGAVVAARIETTGASRYA
ncbi:MAG: hypothetical protein QHJ82_01410 [Verrucomicrobiota bacterium]|nr:hypothetical protein [Verrucomicrobiota bacterium]